MYLKSLQSRWPCPGANSWVLWPGPRACSSASLLSPTRADVCADPSPVPGGFPALVHFYQRRRTCRPSPTSAVATAVALAEVVDAVLLAQPFLSATSHIAPASPNTLPGETQTSHPPLSPPHGEGHPSLSSRGVDPSPTSHTEHRGACHDALTNTVITRYGPCGRRIHPTTPCGGSSDSSRIRGSGRRRRSHRLERKRRRGRQAACIAPTATRSTNRGCTR